MIFRQTVMHNDTKPHQHVLKNQGLYFYLLLLPTNLLSD